MVNRIDNIEAKSDYSFRAKSEELGEYDPEVTVVATAITLLSRARYL